MSFDIMGTQLGKSLNMFAGKIKYFNLKNSVIFQRVLSDRGLQEWILNLIREDQLFDKGIDESGEVIGYYSEYTSRINPSKKFNTHYTLKDTGEFFASFKLTIYPTYFEIDANPMKTNDKGETESLFYKYGEGIIGLTEESKEKLCKEIIERYITELRRWILWSAL